MAAARIEFALDSPQPGVTFKQMVERARTGERLGYHSMWLMDHMWRPNAPDSPQFDCMALMAGLAAATEKIRIGTLVICNSYRNPALLAKELTSIDQISNGRLEVGLGAGHVEPEYKAYGYVFPPIGVRLKQLEEGLHIVKSMFTSPKSTFSGQYYKIDGAINVPQPVQRPNPPILVGGKGEKVLLRLVAKYADRWNYFDDGTVKIEHKLDVIKKHCEAVNRDFSTLTISEKLMICMGTTQAEVDRKWQKWVASPDLPFLTASAIKGTPAQITERLQQKVKSGVTLFIIYFSDLLETYDTLEMFTKEVMPAFR